MEKILDDKINPVLVGLYQAAGVVLYTILVATLMASFEGAGPDVPDLVVGPIILSLFVLSAGITGSLVFGLPVYFTFAKNNVKRAIAILGYTFLYLLIAVLLTFSAIFLIF
jgi:hypothetical protein